MKLLHTSDWHVGKTIRGNSRADEHRAVLAEMAQIAEDKEVDLVLVAGDLFETAAPSPEAEQIVYQALLRFATLDIPVAVISGNHDNARRLRAVQPLLELDHVFMVTAPTKPDDGGVLQFECADGSTVQLAMLPFVSQQGIVRAEELMDRAAFENAQLYADRMRLLVDALTPSFSADTVNIVMAHAFVQGGTAGGGERLAHLVEEYQMSPLAMPVTANYVALGHLHRPQKIPGPTAIHYCGSPLQLDFGEEDQAKQVDIVEIEPGLPARVEAVSLESGRALRTVKGSMEQLRARAGDEDGSDDWLRVIVQEAARAGLADDVREMFGETMVDVRIDSPVEKKATKRKRRQGRSPQDLFAEYMTEQGIDDERVAAMFADLLDQHLQGAEK